MINVLTHIIYFLVCFGLHCLLFIVHDMNAYSLWSDFHFPNFFIFFLHFPVNISYSFYYTVSYWGDNKLPSKSSMAVIFIGNNPTKLKTIYTISLYFDNYIISDIYSYKLIPTQTFFSQILHFTLIYWKVQAF